MACVLIGKSARHQRCSRSWQKGDTTMTSTMTIADENVREAVTSQLAWDSEFDASMIGVTAHDGVVTLSGHVYTYAAKLAAERAARRVYGVKAVANELRVKLTSERIDSEIAKDAIDALRMREGIPTKVEVTVRDGEIALGGTVDSYYQKVAAERAVRYLRGVRGVVNNITVKPAISATNVQKHIVAALHRDADIDARRIHVSVDGSKVTLSGNVRSWAEKQAAERAAWNTAGVSLVSNLIVVAP